MADIYAGVDRVGEKKQAAAAAKQPTTPVAQPAVDKQPTTPVTQPAGDKQPAPVTQPAKPSPFQPAKPSTNSPKVQVGAQRSNPACALCGKTGL